MHVLKGKLSIDVDDSIGLGNLGGARVEGKPILGAFFEPINIGGDAPRATVQTIDTWRGFGGGRIAGLRFVPHSWPAFQGKTGSQAAKLCSDAIAELEQDGRRRIDAVEWDIETHDVAWQLEFLLGKAGTKGIRGANAQMPDSSKPATLGYRWGRPGVWTMEGRQDTSTSVAAIAARTGLLIGPQAYDGPMTQAWDWHFELLTWCLNQNPQRPNGAGISLGQMLPYYDAGARMPVGTVESVLFATSRLAL